MRVSTTTGVMLAIGLLAVSVIRAQSLGDVARQEETRRKDVKSPSKVYTNDNLKNVDPPPPAPTPSKPAADAAAAPAAPSPGDASAPAAAPGAAAEAPRDEKYWRGRLEASRTALSRAQIVQEALQSRINALSTDFVNRDDPAQRNVIAGERQQALAELERVKQEVVQHRKAIADTQEEGRRAGAPAGWLR